MYSIKYITKWFIIASTVLLVPIHAFAFTITTPPEEVAISAQVISTTPPSPSSNSSGGGGYFVSSSITFSGIAYPFARVYIQQDGQAAMTVTADFFARFSATIYNLPTNIYKFSVYAKDSEGRKSASFAFPLAITYGTTVNINNIYLSPTIDIDKSHVARGDSLIIFGQSAPQASVNISVNSNILHLYSATTNIIGQYSYNLDTSSLLFGPNQTKSRAMINSQLTSFTPPLTFIVGDRNKKKEVVECTTIVADLNCDGKVSLIDFSIMAYWYRNTNPPSRVDLNSDGVISLADFSILAFYWTGL